MIDTLRYFQDNIDLKFIYCIKDVGNNKFILSVDPSIEETGEFGDPIVTTDALVQASLGKPAVSPDAYEDKWGRFYSSYSPVFNSSGKVAGIVAVDLNADWYEKQVFNSVRTILISTALSIIVGGLILILVTHISRKRFRYFYSQLSGLKNTIEELLNSIDNIKSLRSLESAKINKYEDNNDIDNIDSLKDEIINMQADLRRKIDIVHKQAFVDKLTSLKNRSAYMEAINKIDRHIDEEVQFTVAVFDICGLKNINDDLGHEAGDMAIIGTANILKDVFGEDCLYRFGGDEFIGILNIHSEIEIKELFNKLDQQILVYNNTTRTYKLSLNISKGWSTYCKGKDSAYREVFKRADIAMYNDKAMYYKRCSNADRRRRT